MSFTIAYGDYDKNPENYFLAENNPLNRVIDIALRLGKPLLLTGEPGTGKTQLAHYAAWYLNRNKDDHPVRFLEKPLVFNTKTSSAGKDLFYEYDAVSHFQDKTGTKKIPEFIQLTAMGQAIIQTMGRIEALERYHIDGIKNLDKLDDQPRSVVVLIDEVDKAPRDFPNDLLNEIENNEFYINELNLVIRRNDNNEARTLVIMTSNVEKNLPDAFLRRCIFYHIPFPSDEDLLKIISKRLQPLIGDKESEPNNLAKKYSEALSFFNKARISAANKKPSTSELLDWIKVLHLSGFFLKNNLNLNELNPHEKEALKLSLVTLFKTKKDFDTFFKEEF